jgi:hypothetical protein
MMVLFGWFSMDRSAVWFSSGWFSVDRSAKE